MVIQNKEYKGITDWSDMPCSMAASLYKIPMPEILKEYYESAIKGNNTDDIVLKLTPEQEYKELPTYFGKVIQIMYGLSDKVLNKIKPQDRTWLYETTCRDFILGLHWNPSYELRGIEYLECDGEKLYLPKFKEVLGKKVPFAYEEAQSFAEAADLQSACKQFEAGLYDVAPTLIAICCRPKDEVYDEDKALSRVSKLGAVDMATVWEVFFCLIEYLSLQKAHDLIYLLKQAKSKQRWQQKYLGWLNKGGWVRLLTYLKNMGFRRQKK